MMTNERIQRLHKFMHDFKNFLRDHRYDIEETDIQGYLRGLVHFNANELKELTMDYKEKYEQAIKLATAYYKANLIINEKDENLMLEDIFPELKESEDEKIRKALIAFIKKRDKSGCDYDYDKWISWLEKQGEKSADEMIEALRTEYEKGRADAITEMQDNQKSAWNEKE